MIGNSPVMRPRRRRPNAPPRFESPLTEATDPIPEDPRALQERLLDQIAEGAKSCQEIESRLRLHKAPELETIIQLHRVLVLRLSAEAQADPELFKLISTLMKPVMDWARLQETRKDRELAEQRYRDQVAAQKAAVEQEQRGPAEALRPATLEKIEHELRLF